MKQDLFDLMKNVSEAQMAALSAKDSGWRLAGEEMCLKSYIRILHLDHEPTEAYISSLYRSAPPYNDVSYNVVHDQVSGLHVLTLFANLDTGD